MALRPIPVERDDEVLFKSIIIGDSGVGKSCIMLRYTRDEFKDDYTVTIGVDFAVKEVNIDNDTRVKLQIWDTAGQETFGSIIKKFFKGAGIVFLVYDVNKRDTFERLQKWTDNAKADCDENAVFVLMGNKADLADEDRKISYQEGEKFMEDNGISFFFETSALNGENIDKAFNEATKLAFLQYIRIDNHRAPQQPGINLEGTSEKLVKIEKSGGCCKNI